MAPDPVEIVATAIARKWADAPDTVDRSCARAALKALEKAGFQILDPGSTTRYEYTVARNVGEAEGGTPVLPLPPKRRGTCRGDHAYRRPVWHRAGRWERTEWAPEVAPDA